MPESVLMGQLHLSKACWELWLADDQPHSDYKGQWQRALCILAVLQTFQPNRQRNKHIWKIYAIKQIKIYAEYRDMLPRHRLYLSGTPGLRPKGLSPGSWQTSLGLGSMSQDSAQILICISKALSMHNSDFTWVPQSTATRLFLQQLVHASCDLYWLCVLFIVEW